MCSFITNVFSVLLLHWCCITNYSEFDKFPLGSMQWAYPFGTHNFWYLSLLSIKFALAIANATGYTMSCKSYSIRSHRCPWLDKCKLFNLRNSTKKFKFIFLLFEWPDTWNMFVEHIFNLSIFGWKQFATDMRSSRDDNHLFWIMHLSLKTIFCIFWQTGIHGPSSMYLHFNL